MDSGIAAILGAIVGAIISGPFSYYFAIKIFEKQKFETAASRFRSIAL